MNHDKRPHEENQDFTQRLYATYGGRRVKVFITSEEPVRITDVSILPDDIVVSPAAPSNEAATHKVFLNTKFQWKECLKELTNNECGWDSIHKQWFVTQDTLDQLGMTGNELERAVQKTFTASAHISPTKNE